MIRIVLILLTITGLSLGAAWLADEPGRVVIDWGNYHIETPLLVILAGVALSALGCMIIYYVLYALLLTPRAWLRLRLAKRQALGLEALTHAFTSIATQDIRSARKQISRAQQYLPHQPLTLMLASQVARLEGNESQSRLYLEQMLKAESTEFMALRGLVENARRSHDSDAALAHAEKALALKPGDHWLVSTLTGLYADKQRTQDALRLIAASARKRVISRIEQRRLTAGVMYEHGKSLIHQQRFELALPALQNALRQQPDLAPASAMLAESYLKQGNIAQALKTIVAAWKIAPHPLLTQVIGQCLEQKEARGKAIRASEKMARMRPEDRETRFLLSLTALKQGNASTARNEIQLLIEGRETARACSAMAEAESVLGDSAQSAYWLKRSQSAPHDSEFTCENCLKTDSIWRFTCQHCGSVGSITWK